MSVHTHTVQYLLRWELVQVTFSTTNKTVTKKTLTPAVNSFNWHMWSNCHDYTEVNTHTVFTCTVTIIQAFLPFLTLPNYALVALQLQIIGFRFLSFLPLAPKKSAARTDPRLDMQKVKGARKPCSQKLVHEALVASSRRGTATPYAVRGCMCFCFSWLEEQQPI